MELKNEELVAENDDLRSKLEEVENSKTPAVENPEANQNNEETQEENTD